MDILSELEGFQWDIGNIEKNWVKHQVSQTECEEVFFNDPLLLFEDKKHSERESRNYVLGQTNVGRKLFIVFTVRNKCIRVISARDMSKRERSIYDKA